MKYKKGLIFIFLILFFLSIAGVCASDAGDVNIQTGNDTVDDVVALGVDSDENDDAIASDEVNGQETMAISDENNVLTAASFGDLQTLIDNTPEGNQLNLTGDYSAESGGDTIKISKDITINGNGHTLDGANKKRIIRIITDGKNVILKNITICNGHTLLGNGGAIENDHSSTSLTLIDCKFNNNYAGAHGGAIYCNGIINVFNSDFNDNIAGDKHLSFNDHNGGAIYSGSKCYIYSSRFNKNYAGVGAAIYSLGDIKITGPNTFKNHDSAYGVIASDNGANIDINWNSNNANDSCEISFGKDEEAGAVYCRGGSVYARYLDVHDIHVTHGGNIGAAISVERYMEGPYGELHVSNSKFNKCSYTSIIPFPETIIDEGNGGVLFSWGKCYVESCKFYDSQAISGGAIYSKGDLTISGTDNIFSGMSIYHTTYIPAFPPCGSAIYCDANLIVHNATFTNNNGCGDGGAIYCNGETTIYNSKFENNQAKRIYSDVLRPIYFYGGAICSHGNLALIGCEFNNNYVQDDGGAVYTYSGIVIKDCNFTNNQAQNGGAVYAHHVLQPITNSRFISNHADGKAGAVYIDDKCDFEFVSCTFENNNCKDSGGAINVGSSKTHLKLSNCNFSENVADADGGAVYSPGEVTVSGSTFKCNRATGGSGQGWGGAIRSKGLISIDKSSFNNNDANEWGGAVYADGEIKITNSKFTYNLAQHAGAVYAATIKEVSHSVFLNNYATAKDGDGGAINIYHKCNPEFYSCRFEGNKANNRGGAIYLNSESSTLKVSYCTFIDNHAEMQDYNPDHKKSTRLAGHSIFNKGTYDKYTLIDMCWFGTNTPNFNEQFVEWKLSNSDVEFTPENYLKIAIMLNETDIYVGNTYKSTVYFSSTQGSKLKKDLLHSTGKFYGSGQHSNVKADINDMTADVIFSNPGNITLFGRLDNQVVTLNNLPVRDKYQSEVRILSCENVVFPDQIKVTYEITNMSDGASYVIKNSEGEIVFKEDITAPSGEIKLIYNVIKYSLVPGSYSVTITNPESRTALGSSANATYTISKGRFGLRIVVFNETYPDEVECIVHTDLSLGLKYNLTVTGESGVVYSSIVPITSHVAHFDIGVLDAGHYTATIFALENELYESIGNYTTFEVSPRGTNFEVEISAAEITYGETATVIPILSPGATGNITYHLNNGTFLDKLAYNETLTLPILDAGSYVIIANYSGDIDDLPAFDTVHLIVNKVNTVFEVRTNVTEITYGETATVMPILPANATGTIKYYLADGTVLGELAIGENLTLPVWDAGSYIIYADYSGDNNFFNATANVTLPVNQVKTVFEVVAESFIYDEIAIVTHTLSPGATGNITYYLSNGTFITELPVNENLTLILWDVGTYDIVANYSGDRNFLNATANAILTINKAKTEIMADPVIVMYNSNGNLLVILKDIRDYPLRGVNVTVDLGGVKNYTTDKEGQILISTNNISVGTYNVVISFNGNTNYMNCSNTTIVTVTKMVDTMTVNPLVTVYQVHKYLVINLKDELNKPIANENVIITINGVSYKCKTDANGNARLIIRLDARVYTAKVTFVNDNYETATKTVKVTVLKAKPKIIAKKKTFKAKKKIKRYKVKLTVHGKPLAKVKVTLKIKGKTYKAKTNSKGKAVFKIKKLTKKGKYKAKITYKGNYLYKKVTKKVKIRIK